MDVEKCVHLITRWESKKQHIRFGVFKIKNQDGKVIRIDEKMSIAIVYSDLASVGRIIILNKMGRNWNNFQMGTVRVISLILIGISHKFP